jgi:hypothetical protein
VVRQGGLKAKSQPTILLRDAAGDGFAPIRLRSSIRVTRFQAAKSNTASASRQKSVAFPKIIADGLRPHQCGRLL